MDSEDAHSLAFSTHGEGQPIQPLAILWGELVRGEDLDVTQDGNIRLLIEAIVWPSRQVKEGYLSTTLTARDGQVVSGFVQREDAQRLVIRDPANETEQIVAKQDVAARQDAGTIMPPGLTASLTREELRDLVRFLAERKGQELGSPPE